MVPQKEGTPVQFISLAADTERGFDASGMTPDFVKHYFSACLQAVDNLSRPHESAISFTPTTPNKCHTMAQPCAAFWGVL